MAVFTELFRNAYIRIYINQSAAYGLLTDLEDAYTHV